MMPVSIVILLMSLLNVTAGYSWTLPVDKRNVENITELDIPADTTGIYMERSSITSLPAGALNFPWCWYLSMTNGELQDIHPDAFEGLENLDTLNLNNNKIKALHLGTFQDASKLVWLTELSLSNNDLTELLNGTFMGLIKLQWLYLSGNNISYLQSNAFGGLVCLDALDLANNLLTSLPAGIFYGLPKIRNIHLSSNQLLSISENLFNPEITELYLDLEDNNLTSLPNIFTGCSKLRELDLLAEVNLLAPDLFEGLGLTSLYLWSLNISHFPTETLKPLVNLIHFSLRSSSLSDIQSETFRGLSKLTGIDLDNNMLSSLPADLFQGLTNLYEIYLGRNRLESLPEDLFRGLSNLNEIYLEDNLLESLPEDSFQNLPSLEFVDLSENRLTRIPANIFFNSTKIEEILLWSNNISSVKDMGLPESWVYLDLYDNPLNCTAEMCWVLHQSLSYGLSTDGNCSFPETLSGQQLDDLWLSDLGCEGM